MTNRVRLGKKTILLFPSRNPKWQMTKNGGKRQRRWWASHRYLFSLLNRMFSIENTHRMENINWNERRARETRRNFGGWPGARVSLPPSHARQIPVVVLCTQQKLPGCDSQVWVAMLEVGEPTRRNCVQGLCLWCSFLSPPAELQHVPEILKNE